MPHFYIDALDPDGGRAFVALRDAGQPAFDAPSEAPCWYIAAPDFAPGPVASRATALAATVRGAQLGLSLDGRTEVAFKELEAVADFVRRLYLGGRDPGEGGAAPGPPTPPGPKPPPGEDSPPGAALPAPGGPAPVLTEALTRHARMLRELSEGLDHRRGQTHAALSPDRAPTGPLTELGAEAVRMLRPALRLLGDALAAPAPGDTEPERSGWLASLAAFAHLGARLDGIDDLSREVETQLARLGPPQPALPGPDAGPEPLDLLGALLLPGGVAVPADGQTVADLVFGCLASPFPLLAPGAGPHRQALLLLGAMILTGGARIPLRVATRPDQMRMLGHWVRDALDWLHRELPGQAFDPALEDLLGEERRPG